jgi:hypothetical protein
MTATSVVNSPDDAFVRKMWQIAQSLGARVVGDEDETYGQDGQPRGLRDATLRHQGSRGSRVHQKDLRALRQGCDGVADTTLLCAWKNSSMWRVPDLSGVWVNPRIATAVG